VTPVDVVVLSWNRAAATCAAIGSALAQEDVDVRVWVVDQGSTPEHLAAIAGYCAGRPAVELIELGRNVGVPAGRNIGSRRGTAPWVASIDNDAVFADGRCLRRMVDRFTADPGLGAVAFRADNFHTGELDLTSWAYPEPLVARADEAFPAARFVGVGHGIRRAAFTEAGGYDDRLFFCEEELDLSYKLIAAGYTILYDPAIRVLHKVDPEARVRWDDRRLFLQIRNAVYLQHRHHRRPLGTALVAGGWLARGVYNRAGRQAARGVAAAFRLLRDAREEIAATAPLDERARRYVAETDTSLRGGVLSRLRHDVLAPLPGLREGS